MRGEVSFLDLVSNAKVRKYQTACRLDNWHFEPFVEDIFEALISFSPVVDKFTTILFSKLAPEEVHKVVADV